MTGSAEPALQGRPPGGGKLAPHLAALIGWVEAEPDITMPERAAKLEAEKDVTAHPASLSRVLLRAGYSFKKTLLASEAQRDDVRQAREEWKTYRQPHMLEKVDALWKAIGDICALYTGQECWNYLKEAGYAPD